jgi:hypothetical protein
MRPADGPFIGIHVLVIQHSTTSNAKDIKILLQLMAQAIQRLNPPRIAVQGGTNAACNGTKWTPEIEKVVAAVDAEMKFWRTISMRLRELPALHQEALQHLNAARERELYFLKRTRS